MPITGNRYATNDTDMRETNVNVDNINTKIGDISTDNTILRFLNTIKYNTTSTNVNQFYNRPSEFEISTEIIRPANTTAYTANAIINTDALATLPVLDFSSLGSLANKPIQINSISLMSSNGSANPKLNCIIHLFNSSTITGQTITDGTTFNPAYANVKNTRVMTFENCTNLTTHGSGFYMLTQTEIMRNCKLDNTSKLYVAVITSGTYTPTSGELITIQVKGYLL